MQIITVIPTNQTNHNNIVTVTFPSSIFLWNTENVFGIFLRWSNHRHQLLLKYQRKHSHGGCDPIKSFFSLGNNERNLQTWNSKPFGLHYFVQFITISCTTFERHRWFCQSFFQPADSRYFPHSNGHFRSYKYEKYIILKSIIIARDYWKSLQSLRK